ncbi:hypothetical protein [Amycolatopsis sp. BJA-103]|uniref:hypothetical protein n=1 Tax=Amycolatopsis sp. BJA-103 TaxID=1911175 RepID=UPI000C78ECBD|nr:hypothetical protein [Amycolatopsis sp. BJA-103]AUI56756.1 hypothetical protein BKN51_00045 [Amycolatopsis sp. BJA-103]AUI56818.1 hypothetical protein BKN51_00375 [Amycolatopsis sp. BJA-103]PNE13461.1 hypothetical protein B1H26_40245 [Amycolatopsis sp. BJA-103]
MTTRTKKTTLLVHEFFAMLTDTMRTSGTDKTLPMLCGVLLHTPARRSVLVATSTDRFTLGQAHAPANGRIPDVWIPLADAKRILAVIKAGGLGGDLAVAVHPDHRVVFTTATVSATITGDGLSPTFPPIGELFNEAAAKPTRETMLSPAYLKRFSEIAKTRGQFLTVQMQDRHKPVHITIGDRYRGLIMPVRAPKAEAAPTPAPVFPVGQPFTHRAARTRKQAA